MKRIVRVHMHGHSTVISIPSDIRAQLALKRNDIMQIWTEDGQIRAEKIDLVERARSAGVVQVVGDGE